MLIDRETVTSLARVPSDISIHTRSVSFSLSGIMRLVKRIRTSTLNISEHSYNTTVLCSNLQMKSYAYSETSGKGHFEIRTSFLLVLFKVLY